MANLFKLDDINGSNGFVVNGIQSGDRLGSSVSNAGDINGDGIADIIISLPGAASAGKSYVVFGGSNIGKDGSVEPRSLDGNNGFTIENIEGISSGNGVSNAGDINNDGITDLIIGAPGVDPAGESYVIFGGTNVGGDGSIETSSLDGSNGFKIKGIQAGDRSGFSVSNAGDINGDGFEDLIIGAPDAKGIPTYDPYNSYNVNNGESYIVFGGDSIGSSGSLELRSLDGSNGFVLNGVDGGGESLQDVDRFGYSVSNAGDVNGDGFDDIIIGAPGLAYYGTQGGNSEIYVVFGGSKVGNSGAIAADALDGTNGLVIDGIDFGRSASSAGDINGDGFDDLIIGAAFSYYYGRGPVFVGTGYLIFGGSEVRDSGVIQPDALDGSNGSIVESSERGDLLGYSASSVGDVNGDGFGDFIIGAPAAGRGGYPDYDSGSGASYIVFGGAEVGSDGTVEVDTPNASNAVVLEGIEDFDNTGFSVSGAGDVNDDGIDDLIVGAPGADPNEINSAGKSYIIFGNAAPQLDLNGKETGIDFTTTFTNNPVFIVDRPIFSLTDTNSDTLFQATVVLTNLLNGGNEFLAADTTGTDITADYDFATGTLSLTGEDSIDNYRQVLKTVTYNNTAKALDTDDYVPRTGKVNRTIEFTLDDGAAFNNTSAVATTKIDFENVFSGRGGQNIFAIEAGSGEITIADFGGVGTGINPSPGVVDEIDTLKFIGSQLTADNLILTQKQQDLELTFEGVANTKVILTDFDLERLDNLPSGIGNILFDRQQAIKDSFDVFDAKQIRSRVFNFDTVTFLNDLDNTLQGFNNSDDVINGQRGNDVLLGRSGNDTLRGGAGDDLLLDGGKGKDRIDGGKGNDGLFGGAGTDEFVLQTHRGTDKIFDFEVGYDRLLLADGLEFEELAIEKSREGTKISLKENEEVLAILIGVDANNLAMSDFS